MTKHIALQMDALSRLNPKSDSTLYLARAALRRGYKLFHYTPAHLRLGVLSGAAHVTASGHELLWQDGAWAMGEAAAINLATVDAILIRQDPPFDLAYITTTHILDHLRGKVKLINDPTGVRDSPEKLLVTHFPQFAPPTLITRDMAAVEEFRQQHADIVIKPIYSFGGHGVFHINPLNDNLPALLEMLAAQSPEPWIVQKFLPVAAMGDKRIILLDGKPVGHFRRVPATGDVRSNMRVGGRVELVRLSPRDREICEAIAPTLVERGLRLAGIDVIGDTLTEINVTCPTGLVTSDELENRSLENGIAEMFWHMVFG